MEHIFKRTVALLNDLNSFDLVLKKALDFSRKHQTTLEVLYVQEEGLFEVPDYFLSEDKIAEERIDRDKIKTKIEEQLLALNEKEKHAILVYVDDTVDRVLNHAKESKEILFITTYHQSLSATLLKETPYSYWILKEEVERYDKIAIPIDFSEQNRHVIQATQHIFPESEIRIAHNYRYLMDAMTVQVDYLDVVPIVNPELLELNEEIEKREKETFEQYQKEFNVQGDYLEAEGALDTDLIQYLTSHDFNLTVLYHHDTELFLSPSLIVVLLDKVESDFLVFNL